MHVGSRNHPLTHIKTRIIANRPAPKKRLIIMAPARSFSIMLIDFFLLLLRDLEGFSECYQQALYIDA